MKAEDVTNVNVRPVALPIRARIQNVRGIVAGWGDIDLSGTAPISLRKLSVVTIMDSEDCVEFDEAILQRDDAICIHRDFNNGYGACDVSIILFINRIIFHLLFKFYFRETVEEDL